MTILTHTCVNSLHLVLPVYSQSASVWHRYTHSLQGQDNSENEATVISSWAEKKADEGNPPKGYTQKTKIMHLYFRIIREWKAIYTCICI